ncbi:MAG: NAD(P)(+) transhydrogenase (Re/Si-specific) subunit alpha [Planctomycetaceae bacterium]|nr:NAD(P)(+) transhydrogenase (Re/Si-specific) subunit alpha [Planctomycetaceae bacterium]
MKLAVLKETFPGERRVAVIPANLAQLTKAGIDVVIEAGAGQSAGFADSSYSEKGATISSRDELFAADIMAQVRTLGTNKEAGRADVERYRAGQIVLGMCNPLGEPAVSQEIASTGASLFGLELIPRITRAQSMDVLSSMATIAGYRAVLLAATELPKIFPMLMTAAGTLTPARVFVIGAGVAGLQAIATARRLGGVVQAYDVRPACRDQVESLGAKFVELEIDAGESEDKGGYAKAMDEDFYRRQRELMANVVAESDVVITTAAISGKQSPLLVTADAVQRMADGGVIVDLAAERGGNCELSQADERVVEHGVVILGPTNLPSEIPNHASQMFSNNVTNFLLNLVKDGAADMNLEDEIIRDTLVAYEGEMMNARMRDMLGLDPLSEPEKEDAEASEEADAKQEDMEVQTEEQQESSDTESDADGSKEDN